MAFDDAEETWMVVDHCDAVFAYGRRGVRRFAAYLDDLDPDVIAQIQDRVSRRESVYLPNVTAMVDWREVE